MHFLILDLEATCWQGNVMDREQEVIEIGAYRLDGYGEWVDQFQAFVRPVLHPRLSPYCIDLTGIQQDQVSKAKPFSQVFADFEAWYFDVDTPHVMCTWGAGDKDLLIEESHRHDMDSAFLPHCINLKTQFATIHQLPKVIGLLKAVEFSDLEFEGQHHRALDDAYNTARLFKQYLDRWQY